MRDLFAYNVVTNAAHNSQALYLSQYSWQKNNDKILINKLQLYSLNETLLCNKHKSETNIKCKEQSNKKYNTEKEQWWAHMNLA